jgi:dipeptidyl-peptidase 4
MLLQHNPLKSAEASNSNSPFDVRQVEGWTLRIHQDLLKAEPQATARAVELLTLQLQEIKRVVPATAVAELVKVPLWFSPEYPKTPPRAEYHPDAGWLKKNQRDPALAKGVEFTNIRIFERETKRMPNFALHELAHAYHDRVVQDGFNNAAIKAAYDKAKASGIYDRVEQRAADGSSKNVKAYAMTSPQEYFAEATEAFFSTNDFYPFHRAQLERHDPQAVSVVRKLWGVPEESTAPPEKADFGFIYDKKLLDKTPTIHWLEQGGYTTLVPATNNAEASEIHQVQLDGQSTVLVTLEMLTPADAKQPLQIQEYEFSKDLDLVLIYTNSVKVWRKNTRGDYWLLRRSTRQLTQIGAGAKPASLMFAKLSPTGSHVGYVCDNNLFIESVKDRQVTQLTTDGSEDVINGTFDWVYEEEFHCRDGWRWSSDGQQIAFWRLNSQHVKKFTMVDNVTGAYPILKSFAYPKTGEINSLCELAVVSIKTGKIKPIEVPGDTRHDYYIPRMEWIKDENQLVLQRVNRLQNALDVMLADPTTGKVELVMTERDGSWLEIQDDVLSWNPERTEFSWLSERDGWRQLYFVSRDGKTTRRVTHGNFDVIKVLHIDYKGGRVYFIASPEHAAQRYLYSAPITGKGETRRLSADKEPGCHDYQLSPDGKYALHTYSRMDIPPQYELVSLPQHKTVRKLADNASFRAKLQTLQKHPVEFFQVEIQPGHQLDGYLIKPNDFDPQKKYPVIFYVYTEPAGQAVMDRWGGLQFLWHLALSQRGYCIACIDNRGTPAPKGHDWRKAVYRKIGTLAAAEQSAAAKELLKRPYLDATRVGAWGWSGGGSATLNLLFRHPEIYHTGIAIASVPDMRMYNTIYQERYMGLPQDNMADYVNGSPITHAAGLQGNLLLIHGSGDDNCHYQGVEKLADKLIELNKPFTMIEYPNRSHSINEGKNTTRHLHESMSRYFLSNLPAGGK